MGDILMLKSLANKTDLIYHGFEGDVVTRDTYVVVRTPANPQSYLGNQIILPKPPQAAELNDWIKVFRQEVGTIPGVSHVTINFEERATPDCAELAHQHGLKFVENIVLQCEAQSVTNSHRDDIAVFLAEAEEDWQFIVNGQLADQPFPSAQTQAFYEHHFQNQRTLMARATAVWFLAQYQGERACSLGLMFQDRLARFQAIRTDPRYRRRGLCTHLMCCAMAPAKKEFGTQTFVIVTNESLPAALSVYKKIGFTAVGYQSSLSRW